MTNKNIGAAAVSDAPSVGLTDAQRQTIQAAADTAHRILCAGGDYGDELSEPGLRRELNDSRDALRALLTRHDKEADDDIEEAREILENMVRSIELDGNYSTEATCTFLRQALNCLPVAAPLANEESKPAPSVEQDERGEDEDDYQPTPESERAAFNAMMRWHLIRMLQAWRYGGDLRAVGMAAFEWARSNDVGKEAFKASEKAVKIAASTSANVAQDDDTATLHKLAEHLESGSSSVFSYEAGEKYARLLRGLLARTAPANVAQGAEAATPGTKTFYVECNECAECGHTGINDSHPADASCGYSCGWTGPSPIEDKCPGCQREGVMGLACPKCSGRYSILAEAHIPVAAPPAQTALTDAARDVLAERERQVSTEGWTPEHDDEHEVGELARAAACYAANATGYRLQSRINIWPWDREWWKPTTPRRDLVKAGALILAEVERIDRRAASRQSTDEEAKS